MFKLNTQLAFFRFNTTINKEELNITWFILEPVRDGEQTGRCFTETELALFQDYVINNPVNFPGIKNYQLCENESAPHLGVYSIVPRAGLSQPLNVVLRSNPEFRAGSIYDSMDIILTSENGEDNHQYNLGFDVIGRIE